MARTIQGSVTRLFGRLLRSLLGLLFVLVVRGVGVVAAHTRYLIFLLPNQKSNKVHKNLEALLKKQIKVKNQKLT